MSKVWVYKNTIHICDSYLLKRREFKDIIEDLKQKYPDNMVLKRSYYSLLVEWTVHKVSYKLNILPEHTKCADLDLTEFQNHKLLYYTIGTLLIPFV